MEVAARYSRHSPLQVGVGVRRDRSECRESTVPRALQPADRRRSCRRPRHTEPAVRGRSCCRSWLTRARRSREITPLFAAHPSPPFAGDHAAVRGSPRPAVRGRSRWPASDSMPAGSPLTQAHRIAADSCPPAAAIPSPVDQVHMSWPGVPCCLVVPTGTF